jgi:hypothetical protein
MPRWLVILFAVGCGTTPLHIPIADLGLDEADLLPPETPAHAEDVDLAQADVDLARAVDLAPVPLDFSQPIMATVPAASPEPLTFTTASAPSPPPSLCGPTPCQVQLDELVIAGSAFASSIALDAHDQPTVAVWTDKVLTRGDSGWTTHLAPEWFAPSIAFDHGGALHVVEGFRLDIYFGHFAQSTGGWSAPEPIGRFDWWPLVGPLLVDGADHLWATAAGRYGYQEATTLWQHTPSGWTGGVAFASVSDFTVGAPQVALAPDGRAHVVGWADQDSTHAALMWRAPPDPPEVVGAVQLRAGPPSPEPFGDLALAVTAGEQPHVLYVQSGQLIYATRAGGVWSRTVVADEMHPPIGCSGLAPIADCDEVDLRYLPIAVLTTGGGEIRLLYSRYRQAAHFAAHPNGPFNQWYYDNERDLSGDLMLAWPSGSQVEQAAIAPGFLTSSAHAAVDSRGRIHLVGVHREDQPVAYADLRYLLIGPRP